MNFEFWISLIVCLTTLLVSAEIAVGMRKLKYLHDFAPEIGANPPRLSIIVSALNEASTIEPAMRSLLALNYPNLEIIAINDRSTDATGAILDRLSHANSALRVLQIDKLPAGWLGKNHALHEGAKVASGDFLLFTDADVMFDASALNRAVARCQNHALDHLVVIAELIVKDRLLAAIMLNGYISLYLTLKPWKASTSQKHYMGMGAFNLVRTSAYRKVGGHERLALEVVDDIMLGKLMKAGGFSQEVLQGAGMVAVEWYRSTWDMVKGLEKNSYAMCDYQPIKLIFVTSIVLPVRYWPWVGLLIATGAAWWLCLAALAMSLATFVVVLRYTIWSPWCLIYWPLTGIISLATIWRGVILTWIRGGVIWRGTKYSLAELKRGHH